ncbi:hypothetical protein HYDPIDRAFT_33609 [Hydnomerulius pinastri MD-312]|uniref:Uncharacterized protein n=1 Tax=Hydnomerulius pinastri MD-312 TaxID=994086 RepID=A0A0C9VMV3_9AGAM|nr:hypothetical protein HYDPIDRAFT_33609 [Hydnomerulius pinastri MD-312]
MPRNFLKDIRRLTPKSFPHQTASTKNSFAFYASLFIPPTRNFPFAHRLREAPSEGDYATLHLFIEDSAYSTTIDHVLDTDSPLQAAHHAILQNFRLRNFVQYLNTPDPKLCLSWGLLDHLQKEQEEALLIVLEQLGMRDVMHLAQMERRNRGNQQEESQQKEDEVQVHPLPIQPPTPAPSISLVPILMSVPRQRTCLTVAFSVPLSHAGTPSQNSSHPASSKSSESRDSPNDPIDVDAQSSSSKETFGLTPEQIIQDVDEAERRHVYDKTVDDPIDDAGHSNITGSPVGEHRNF